MSVVSLDNERIERSEANIDIDPIALLRFAMDKVEKLGVKKVLVVVEIEKEDGTSRIDSYRAGLTRHEEAALLALAQHVHLNDWFDV